MARGVRMSYGVTVEQEAVLTAMLSGMSQKDAAAAGGVTPETVSRWLGEPFGAFNEELDARRTALRIANQAKLRQLAAKAVDAIETLLESESESVRLRAACAVLKSCGLDGE
jgi:predicted transcriptional regulator